MNIDYENYEVILVDNNSTDDSIEFVKNTYPSVIIIKLDKNYGFAEPNNIGAKNARGDFLLFLNNDTKVKPNFISEMIKSVEKDSKIAICQSLLLKPDGDIDSSGDFLDSRGLSYSSKNKVTHVKKILSAKGASMMVRKDSFLELGGFDKKFFASFEDVDLGLRAWIWGYEVVLVPQSVVYHSGGQTTQQTPMIKFHGAKNSLILRLVYFEPIYAISSITKLFFAIFFNKFVRISQDHESIPSLPSLQIIFRGAMWVLKNLRYVNDKRKKVNSKRVRSTRDLIKIGLITKP